MAIASAGGAPPPAWLDTLGKIAGVILGLELIVVLLITCALMVGLVLALRWLNMHVVPVLHDNTPKARRVLQIAEQNTNRVVGGVADFYGRRQAVETGIRVLLFGRQSARRLQEDALVQAATDLDEIQADASPIPGGEHEGAARGGHRRNPAITTPIRPREGNAPQNEPPTAQDEHPSRAGNAG